MRKFPQIESERVIVTGATGFVGAHLVRRLAALDFDIHIVLRKDTDPWRIRDFLRKVTVHILDLQDEKSVTRLVREVRPQTVFHLAAETISSSSSLLSAKDLVENNLIGTISLFSACSLPSLSLFVNTGSSSEYGLATKPMREEARCEPLTAYGVAKLAATLYGQMLAQTKELPVVTLRLFSPFGPYDSLQRLIPNAILSAINNLDIHLSSLRLVRDYVFIEDVVDAYLACLSQKEKLAGKVFNVGGGKQRSIGSVVQTILRLTGSKSRILVGRRQPPVYESVMWQANLRNTRRMIGWKPSSTLLSGLQRTVRWFQGNQNLYAG